MLDFNNGQISGSHQFNAPIPEADQVDFLLSETTQYINLTQPLVGATISTSVSGGLTSSGTNQWAVSGNGSITAHTTKTGWQNSDQVIFTVSATCPNPSITPVPSSNPSNIDIAIEIDSLDISGLIVEYAIVADPVNDTPSWIEYHQPFLYGHDSDYILARCRKTGCANSDVVSSGPYPFKCDVPVINYQNTLMDTDPASIEVEVEVEVDAADTIAYKVGNPEDWTVAETSGNINVNVDASLQGTYLNVKAVKTNYQDSDTAWQIISFGTHDIVHNLYLWDGEQLTTPPTYFTPGQIARIDLSGTPTNYYITYTTDGSTPDINSAAWDNPEFTTPTTVKLIAFASSDGTLENVYANIPPSEASETISFAIAAPIIPQSQTFFGTPSTTQYIYVNSTDSTQDGVVNLWYTLDGSTPVPSGTSLQGYWDADNSRYVCTCYATAQFVALMEWHGAVSDTASATYIVRCYAPTLTPVSGAYPGAVICSADTDEDSNTKYYSTTDYSTPSSTNGSTGRFVLVDDSRVVKMIRTSNGLVDSDVTTRAYEIEPFDPETDTLVVTTGYDVVNDNIMYAVPIPAGWTGIWAVSDDLVTYQQTINGFVVLVGSGYHGDVSFAIVSPDNVMSNIVTLSQ